MDHVKQVARAINWNYVLYAVAAATLLYALTSPLIIDPLIAFLFAGIVPGTDIVLSPEIVLIILMDIFGLAAVVFLVGLLIRRRLLSDEGDDYTKIAELAGRLDTEAARTGALEKVALHARAARAMRQSAHQTAKAAQYQAIPVQSARPSSLSGWVSRHPLVGIAQSGMSALGWLAAAGVLVVAQAMLRMTSFVARYLIFGLATALLSVKFLLQLMIEGVVQLCLLLARGLRQLLAYGTWTLYFFIVLLGVTIDYGIRISRLLWVRSEPYLRQFDSWLELRCRVYAAKLIRRIKQFEFVQAVSMVMHDSIATLRGFFK
jgi:hypothetical protein